MTENSSRRAPAPRRTVPSPSRQRCRPVDTRELLAVAETALARGAVVGDSGQGRIVRVGRKWWFVKLPVGRGAAARLSHEAWVSAELVADGFGPYVRRQTLVSVPGGPAVLVGPTGTPIAPTDLRADEFEVVERFVTMADACGWGVFDDLQCFRDRKGVFIGDLAEWVKYPPSTGRSDAIARLRELAHWSLGADENVLLVLPQVGWIAFELRGLAASTELSPDDESFLEEVGASIAERRSVGLQTPREIEELVAALAARG